MRIAMISGEYPPLEGGVGDFTRALSLELLRQGHAVQILTGKQGDGVTVTEEEGLTIHRCISHWDLRAYPRISRWIADVHPDVVNIQYQPAIYEMKGAIHLLPRWQGQRSVGPSPDGWPPSATGSPTRQTSQPQRLSGGSSRGWESRGPGWCSGWPSSRWHSS